MLGITAVAEQLARLMAQLDRQAPRRRTHGRVPGGVGPPHAFAVYPDPHGRFELHYPSEWTFRGGAAPTAVSASSGLFARVDLLPPQGELWARLSGRWAGLTYTRRGEDRAEGRLILRGRAFVWQARAYLLPSLRMVLSTGGVVDRASAAVQDYRRRLLAAVRRQFRLGPGLRSDA